MNHQCFLGCSSIKDSVNLTIFILYVDDGNWGEGVKDLLKENVPDDVQ